MSDALPSGWILVEIGELCDLVNGKPFKKTDWSNKGLPIIRIQNLNNKNALFNCFHGEIDDKFIINNGQLLFAWSGTPGTSFGAHVWQGRKSVLNQHIYKVVFDEKYINKDFFRYAINQKLEEVISQAQGGVGLRHITKTKFQKTKISFPPYNEQKRIAEKLKQLLTAVDATKNRLDKVPTILKRFRQSVLSAAVSGELTKDWRSQQVPECAVSKIDIEKKLIPDYFGLPQQWQWNIVGELIQGIESGKNIKCEERSPEENECGIVKISAVTWGFFNENESKTLNNKELFLENRRIKKGDLLISRANTLELLGAPVIVDKITKNLMLSDKVLRLLSVDGYKEWLNICLRSPLGRYQIELLATGNQLSMRNIAQKNLKRVHIPIPSKEEIVEIIKRVETLFNLADEFETKLSTSTQDVEKLTTSILAKAFRGELVPQDKNDESAELLLEKIAEINRQKETSRPIRRRKKAMPSKAKKGSLHSIVEILQSSEKPVSAQQLLAVLAPGSPDAEEVENFFVDLRDSLTNKEIIRERKGDEDWFSMATGSNAS